MCSFKLFTFPIFFLIFFFSSTILGSQIHTLLETLSVVNQGKWQVLLKWESTWGEKNALLSAFKFHLISLGITNSEYEPICTLFCSKSYTFASFFMKHMQFKIRLNCILKPSSSYFNFSRCRKNQTGRCHCGHPTPVTITAMLVSLPRFVIKSHLTLALQFNLRRLRLRLSLRGKSEVCEIKLWTLGISAQKVGSVLCFQEGKRLRTWTICINAHSGT